MTLVVDASVVVKWLLIDPTREAETTHAERLMAWALESRERIVQPAHWLIEVGAVLARLSPSTAVDDIAMLAALELPTEEGPAILERACRLAIDLRQHLFDTLYHAVALETTDATLVTADLRYLAAGALVGRIVRLTDWEPT